MLRELTYFLIGTFWACNSRLSAEQLDLELGLDWDGEALAVGAAGSGRPQITRADYLLSGFALGNEDGTWLEASEDLVGFISHGGQRETFSLGDIPAGSYRTLRFQIGLDAENNHRDPNAVPPDHPLNPTLNNLHWTWQDGYIFAAIEGHSPGGRGFSYHLGNDENAATVELPLELDTTRARTIAIGLDLARVLADIDPEARPSTHSRPGDPLAGILKENLSVAFRVREIRDGVFRSHTAPETSPVLKGTPYPSFIASHLPEVALPADNPLTIEGVALGRALFEDPILSRERNLSCSSCHQQENGFSDPARFSIGTHGEAGERQSMPLANLAWHREMFWDGRAKSLREQILHPIENPVELDLSLDEALARLNADARYPGLFEQVFDCSEITSGLLAKAIEQFLLTLVSQDSRFDEALLQQVEFTEQEKRGFELFITESDPANGMHGADCFHCHGGPLLTNHGFANNGLDAVSADRGYGAITKNPVDDGKFKVPSLRNVALTAPYMHDGRFATLEEVVEHYNSGVRPSPTLDPNLAKHPDLGLNLSEDDKAALVAFLKTLTDHQFTQTSP